MPVATTAPTAISTASGVESNSVSHTWETAGKLGLTLKQRGKTVESPEGATLKDLMDPNMEKMMRSKGIKAGMVVKEVNGEDMTTMAYTAVMEKIKGAGRPLTITFTSESAARMTFSARSGSLFGGSTSPTEAEAARIKAEEKARAAETFERLFEHYDTDQTGTLDSAQMLILLKVITRQQAPNLSKFMQEWGTDTSGIVQRQEYLKHMHELANERGPLFVDHIAQMADTFTEAQRALVDGEFRDVADALFDAFDKDSSGSLEAEEVEILVRALKPRQESYQDDKMMQAWYTDGDMKVSREEFHERLRTLAERFPNPIVAMRMMVHLMQSYIELHAVVVEDKAVVVEDKAEEPLLPPGQYPWKFTMVGFDNEANGTYKHVETGKCLENGKPAYELESEEYELMCCYSVVGDWQIQTPKLAGTDDGCLAYADRSPWEEEAFVEEYVDGEFHPTEAQCCAFYNSECDATPSWKFGRSAVDVASTESAPEDQHISEVTADDVATLFRHYDSAQNGVLDSTELLVLIKAVTGKTEVNPVRLMKVWDTNNDGEVSQDECLKRLNEMGQERGKQFYAHIAQLVQACEERVTCETNTETRFREAACRLFNAYDKNKNNTLEAVEVSMVVRALATDEMISEEVGAELQAVSQEEFCNRLWATAQRMTPSGHETGMRQTSVGRMSQMLKKMRKYIDLPHGEAMPESDETPTWQFGRSAVAQAPTTAWVCEEGQDAAALVEVTLPIL